MSTPFHAKLLALELTKRAEFGTPAVFARALSDAQVDLNPYQVDAALFAARSPVSKGAILADEVGLGKTIEAALLLGQRWAEQRRKLLIIVPANLRKQWSQELHDKFHLPTQIIERRSIQAEAAKGNFNPFNQKNIVIVSYPFAARMGHYIKDIKWDMVVIDEAHRLRNVYKSSSKHANAIKMAVAANFKVLLTATPLQNSLMELFGLVSVIDEYFFGSLEGFREKYTKAPLDAQTAQSLKQRLSLICKRTLRNDVRQFVKFTKRLALVQEFKHNPDEQRLYNLVNEFLQRPTLYTLPSQQRHLMTMVLRKLLASSTFAISNTLKGYCTRLENMINRPGETEDLPPEVTEDLDKLDETAEDWDEEEDGLDGNPNENIHLSREQIVVAREELTSLKEFVALAESIKTNSKGEVLISALRIGFQNAQAAQGNNSTLQRKAIIFTESRRTQEYLKNVLEADSSGFSGKVMLFNGSNTDQKSREIYEAWITKHKGSDKISGSKTADIRAALVDYFRDTAEIMIATEAAAEGINLQFCNLVVNYDLPWNPQRIEQRIGRCHRYGQRYDVIVVNFVNINNAADQRVYQLLKSKFLIFESVFGASDAVLGLIDATGVAFEKRISQICQNCRTEEEIHEAFTKLESEMIVETTQAKSQARVDLMNNFDKSVVEKVRIGEFSALDSVAANLWRLSKFILENDADFDDENYRFHLKRALVSDEDSPVGIYELKKNNVSEVHTYRIGHPLAEYVLNTGKNSSTPTSVVRFTLTGNKQKISSLESYLGKSGWLSLTKLSFIFRDGQSEEHLLISSVTDEGIEMNAETARAMFNLVASVESATKSPDKEILEQIASLSARELEERKLSLSARNAKFLKEEISKMEDWEEDQRALYRSHYNVLDQELRTLNRQLAGTMNLQESLDLEGRKIKLHANLRIENSRYQDQCRALEEKKLGLLLETKSRLSQESLSEEQFRIRWRLV